MRVQSSIGGKLVQTLARAGEALEELHVHVQPVPRLGVGRQNLIAHAAS
jgi:hypothetical protein